MKRRVIEAALGLLIVIAIVWVGNLIAPDPFRPYALAIAGVLLVIFYSVRK